MVPAISESPASLPPSLPLSLIQKPEPSPFPHTVYLLLICLTFSHFLKQNQHPPEKLLEITLALYLLSLSYAQIVDH